MHDFNDRQARARQEVQHLHQLALDAEHEGQFATMERLLEHAVSIVQPLDDLPLLIKERYYLACAQDMQGKNVQAIATYSWLIGLASNPTSSQLLTDHNTLSHLSRSFMRFVDCGQHLPEMPVEALLRVVAEGLDWLERVGKANWAAGLRLQKGSLLKIQGDMEGARLELEAALSLKRRHPEMPGYNLAVHQLALADLLLDPPFNAYAEAIALTQEALSSSTGGQHARQRAYSVLSDAHLAMGDYEEALNTAQQSLLLAQTMETPNPMINTYSLLGRIYRGTGHLVEAVLAVTQQWHWGRRSGNVDFEDHYTLRNCARVRNLQARSACGLPAKLTFFPERLRDFFPEQIPIEAQVTLALRRVQSVRRFVQWATPMAVRLDRQSGDRSCQEELDYQLQAANELETWLTQKGNK